MHFVSNTKFEDIRLINECFIPYFHEGVQRSVQRCSDRREVQRMVYSYLYVLEMHLLWNNRPKKCYLHIYVLTTSNKVLIFKQQVL